MAFSSPRHTWKLWKALFPHMSLSQASWSVLPVPSIAAGCWGQYLSVPLNAFSKSHLSPQPQECPEWGNRKPFHLSWGSHQAGWPHHHSCSRIVSLLALATSTRSLGHHPHGHGVWGMVGGQSEMPLHPLTIKKQFLSSPGFPFVVVSFWLDFRVLQKMTLTVFTSSLVVLGKEWSPGLPYSTNFGCPAPFEYSFYVWGNSYIVSLNIPKVEAQDLFSLSPLQPVVHLHPSKIGPVSQKYIKT